MEKPPGANSPHTVYNIGCSQPVQLMDFIRTMEEAIGKKAVLEMCPMQAGDVKITYADTSALENTVGYKPATKLKDGLKYFVEWWKKNYD
jgi:UDP-glucuronate 4-epimerase